MNRRSQKKFRLQIYVIVSITVLVQLSVSLCACDQGSSNHQTSARQICMRIKSTTCVTEITLFSQVCNSLAKRDVLKYANWSTCSGQMSRICQSLVSYWSSKTRRSGWPSSITSSFKYSSFAQWIPLPTIKPYNDKFYSKAITTQWHFIYKKDWDNKIWHFFLLTEYSL